MSDLLKWKKPLLDIVKRIDRQEYEDVMDLAEDLTNLAEDIQASEVDDEGEWEFE
jgi:hypothetical protein